MLFQFINVLLQTLIAKSHDLLREEIVSVIYNMVSVDFAAFHKSFLPSFVDSVDSLSVQQKTLLLSNFSTAHVSLHYQGGHYTIYMLMSEYFNLSLAVYNVYY